MENKKNKGKGGASRKGGDAVSQSDQMSMINDKYDGYGVDMYKKAAGNNALSAVGESQVLNSTFLGALKVVEVKGSDSEEYFWEWEKEYAQIWSMKRIYWHQN